jgi:hypothetical protein
MICVKPLPIDYQSTATRFAGNQVTIGNYPSIAIASENTGVPVRYSQIKWRKADRTGRMPAYGVKLLL